MDKPEKVEIKHNLAAALNVNPLVIEGSEKTTSLEPITLSPEEELAKQDFEEARKNIKDILDQGSSVFDRFTAVAMRSEKARDFEVIAKLMDSLVDANHKLIELHEKRRGLVPDEEPKTQENITNNTLVVGSAAELLEMIEQRKKSQNAPDNIYTDNDDD